MIPQPDRGESVGLEVGFHKSGATASGKLQRVAYPHWGHPNCPVLPAALRLAWLDDPLPEWLQEAFGRGDLKTYGQLDHDALLPFEVLPQAVLDLFARRVDEHIETIRDVIPLERDDWASLDIDLVPSAMKTKNAIKRALWRKALQQSSTPTFQELLEVQGLGPKGVLDFLCSAEFVLSRPAVPAAVPALCAEEIVLPEDSAQNADHDAAQVAELLDELEHEPWVVLVRGDDPRFEDLHLPTKGSLLDALIDIRISGTAKEHVARAISRVAPEIRKRIAAIEMLTLEKQLEDCVRAAKDFDEHRAQVYMARFGWDGRVKGTTLDVAGTALSVTRERVRQVANDILEKIPVAPIFLPGLDAALAVLKEHAPLPSQELGTHLTAVGISTSQWTPEALLRVAKHFHRSVDFTVTRAGPGQMIVPTGEASAYNNLLRHVNRHVQGLGLAQVDQIWETFTHPARDAISAARLLEMLTAHPDFVISEGWCWKHGVLPSRFAGATRQMLAISPVLSAERFYAGLDRDFRFTFRRLESSLGCQVELAPLPIVLQYLRGYKDVAIQDNHIYWNGEPILDAHSPLDVELIDLVRAAPNGMADRDLLFAEWRTRGLNRDTLATKLTYVPYVMRVDRGVWVLRGLHDLPELETNQYTRQRDSIGTVRECVETTPGQFVVSLTVPVRSEWEAIELPLDLSEGWDGTDYALSVPATSMQYQLEVVALGPSAGLLPLLTTLDAREGDILQLRVNLDARRGVVEIMSRADYGARISEE